jgi:acyl-CoA thioester hydrolase
VFFRWFETARIAYTTRLGLKGMMHTDRVGPILASITCDYRRQVTFPDVVLVGSRVSRIGRTSFGMDHSLVSVAGRATAAEGRSTIVVYDYAASIPVPVPAPIRQAIETLEGRTFDPPPPPSPSGRTS